jgi:hypothetical protein
MALSMQEKQHALERGCSEVPPCPDEGERDHTAGVLCHYGIQSSVCSLSAPEVCEARDSGSSDPAGPYQAFPLQRSIHILQARLLSTTSQNLSLGAVTRRTISL